MTVYIEYVIVDNMVIDFLIATLALRLAGRSAPVLRRLSCAVLGTAVAITIPLITSLAAITFFIKLICSVVLVLTIVPKGAGFRGFIRLYIFFLTLTFVFGGLALAVNSLVSTTIPVGLYGLLGLIVFLPLREIVQSARRSTLESAYQNRAIISLGSHSIECDGFVDSGNRLYDPVTGFPVTIIDIKKLTPIYGEGLVLNVMVGRIQANIKERNGHFISFQTLSDKKGKLLVFMPDQIEIYSGRKKHTIYDVMIGVMATNPLSLSGKRADMLLHPDLMIG